MECPVATGLGKRERPQADDEARTDEEHDTTIAPGPDAPDAASQPTGIDLLRSPEHYKMTKRTPIRRESTRDDVYVKRGTQMRALRERCRERLDTSGRVVVHGLGAATTRACDLALAVFNDTGGRVTLDTRTESVTLFDDYTPLLPNLPSVTKRRVKSAIHIVITTRENYI